MYAVIATGGKQYRVEKGGVLRVDKLDAAPGATVEFDQVLLVADGANVQVGAPLLKGSKVRATVEKHARGDNISNNRLPYKAHQAVHGNADCDGPIGKWRTAEASQYGDAFKRSPLKRTLPSR